tara:strand:+ start:830 stop:1213 length:384 start_codon:yes stop_codon:yes gene_type:complete
MKLLGIEELDRDYLQTCTSAMVEQTSADASFSELSLQLQDFLRYLEARFAARESNSKVGLIDELSHTQADGARLSREELFNYLDVDRLFTLHDAGACFVTRAKVNSQIAKDLFGAERPGARDHLRSD